MLNVFLTLEALKKIAINPMNKVLLVLLSLCLYLQTMDAQVVSDDNGHSGFANPASQVNMVNFLVPAGNDRLLVFSVTDFFNVGISQVSFDGIPMTLATEGFTEVYYLTLGSGDAISGTITCTFNGDTNTSYGASTFQNVHQSFPLAEATNYFDTTPDVLKSDANYSLNVQSGNLVLDLICTDVNGPLTSGPEQTTLWTETFNFDMNGFLIYDGSSYNIADEGSEMMSWSWPENTGGYFHGVVEFNRVGASIPTLSQWGMIILSLLFGIFGVYIIKVRKFYPKYKG